MALINICGFDTGDASELFTTAGTVSFVSSPVHSSAGGYAFRSNPTTTGTGHAAMRKVSTTTGAMVAISASIWVRVWFRYATKPSTASEPIISYAGNNELRIDSDGKLSFWDVTQLGSTGTTVLAADTWYRIDVKFVTGAWAVRINGSVEISGTDAISTNTDLILGKDENRNGNTVDFFYDDVAIDDAAYPADGQCALLVPNGAGNYQTFTRGGTDSGANWSQVEEVPHNSDTDYLLSTLVIGEAETEAMTTVSTSSVAGVKGVAIIKRDVNNGTVRSRLRSGSTDSDTTTNTGSTVSYALLGSAGVYATDPATSAAWTSSGIAGVEFGVIQQEVTDKTRITFIGVVVDYVPAEGVAFRLSLLGVGK